jgi:hypothetical protein
MTLLAAILWVGRRYAPGDWITEIDKDPLGRLGPIAYSMLFVFAPSIVFGILLWSGLTNYPAKSPRRIALALAVALGPAIIIQAGPYLLSPLSPTAPETIDAAERTRLLESKIEASKKDHRYPNDPAFKREIVQLELSLKQARSVTYPARVYRPLAASAIAGLAACCTLLLMGLAISGKDGLAPWGTPIAASALLAITGGMVISTLAVDDPLWLPIETISYSCWGSVVVCAAFGLSRAAALGQDVERSYA